MAAQSTTTIPTRTEDPILAAIAAHQEAHRAFLEAVDGLADIEFRVAKDHPWFKQAKERETETSDAADKAARALAATVPTTLAGVRAVLDYAARFDPKDEDCWPEGFNPMLHKTTARALATIIAAVGWNPADPIMAVVDRHKAAVARFEAAALRSEDLEASIPEARRRTKWEIGTFDPVEGDDADWIEAAREFHAAAEEERQAALALAAIEPTTPAGVAALLAHVRALDATCYGWPSVRCEDWQLDERGTVEFHGALHETITTALAKMPAVSAAVA